MTPEERERVLAKVRAMMARAKDPNCPEAEVEASIGFVRKFMDQFNIDEAEVLQSEKGQENAYDSMVNEPAMKRTGRGYHQNDRTLAAVVDVICDTRHFYRRGSELKNGDWKETNTVLFYGMPRDVAVAKEMFQILIASMTGMAQMKCGKGWSAKHNAYGAGFSDRLWTRAYEMKRSRSLSSTPEATAGAIVLVKDNLLKRYANEKLNLIHGKGRASKQYGGSAYGQGYADGGNVSLGTSGLGNSGRSQGRLQ